MDIKRFDGFTLAETLVTLAILGVVTAMTIPSLMQKHDKQVAVAGLEKAFSVISQAFKTSEAENGSSPTWPDPTSSTDFQLWLNTYIIPYLSYTKICTSANYSECWATNSHWLDGKTFTLASSCNGHIVVLKDGTTFLMYDYAINAKRYIITFVDINGIKKPNIAGKDIFRINIVYSDGIVSLGLAIKTRESLLENHSDSCEKTPGDWKGGNCAAIIQMDGWQIKDDYPW